MRRSLDRGGGERRFLRCDGMPISGLVFNPVLSSYGKKGAYVMGDGRGGTYGGGHGGGNQGGGQSGGGNNGGGPQPHSYGPR